MCFDFSLGYEHLIVGLVGKPWRQTIHVSIGNTQSYHLILLKVILLSRSSPNPKPPRPCLPQPRPIQTSKTQLVPWGGEEGHCIGWSTMVKENIINLIYTLHSSSILQSSTESSAADLVGCNRECLRMSMRMVAWKSSKDLSVVLTNWVFDLGWV